VSMICGSDSILAKPTNDSGKIANGSRGMGREKSQILRDLDTLAAARWLVDRRARLSFQREARLD
jgi:hypothetical protein